eukprot:GHVP01056472.1.p1 GENE.GHVP01056472.1~~GHVP01056472.1.p1  ORF type:complete len:623 (-),score=69.73 GHVP01056472.1:117-1985(-)
MREELKYEIVKEFLRDNKSNAILYSEIFLYEKTDISGYYLAAKSYQLAGRLRDGLRYLSTPMMGCTLRKDTLLGYLLSIECILSLNIKKDMLSILNDKIPIESSIDKEIYKYYGKEIYYKELIISRILYIKGKIYQIINDDNENAFYNYLNSIKINNNCYEAFVELNNPKIINDRKRKKIIIDFIINLNNSSFMKYKYLEILTASGLINNKKNDYNINTSSNMKYINIKYISNKGDTKENGVSCGTAAARDVCGIGDARDVGDRSGIGGISESAGTSDISESAGTSDISESAGMRESDHLNKTDRSSGKNSLSSDNGAMANLEYQSSLSNILSLPVLLFRDEYEKTVLVCEELTECYGYLFETAPQRITAYYSLGDMASLYKFATLLIDTDNKRSETWYAIGVFSLMIKRREESIKYFNRAIQINPENLYAFVALGHVHSLLGENNLSLLAYTKASDLLATSFRISMYKGMEMLCMGDRDNASKCFVYSLESYGLDGHVDPFLFNEIGVYYYKTGEISKSLFFFEGALEAFMKTNIRKYMKAIIQNTGLVLMRMGLFKKAQDLFIEGKTYVDRYFVNTCLGFIYEKKGEIDRAVKYYNMADGSPCSGVSVLLLGRLLKSGIN